MNTTAKLQIAREQAAEAYRKLEEAAEAHDAAQVEYAEACALVGRAEVEYHRENTVKFG